MLYRVKYILFISFLIPIYSFAQDVVFTTQVPAKRMGIQDAVQVTYLLENAQNISGYGLEPNTDFKNVGGQPMVGQNFNMMNGDVSVSRTFTYVLQPRQKGVLTLPLCYAIMNGKKYRSNAVNIEVVEGSLAKTNSGRRAGPRNVFEEFFGEDPFEEMRKAQDAFRKQQQALRQQKQQWQDQQKQQQSQESQLDQLDRSHLGDNLFIKVIVDKDEVTVGEQIMASYKLYTLLPMQVNLTKLPILNNFWTQDFDIPQPPRPEREVVNGKVYQVFTIKKSALFPTQSGALELDPAEAEGMARIVKSKRVKQRNPLADIFEDDPFFGSLFKDDPFFNDNYATSYDYEDVPVKLKSKPVIIKVNEVPVPADSSNSFTGAVGKYSIESKIDRTELSTDDIGVLTITIRGTGNLKLIGVPNIRFPDNIDLFDPVESDTITGKSNNKISGYKTIKFRFAPRASGMVRIPSAEFTYYDPETKSFITDRTSAYTLTVRPGKNKKTSGKLPKDIHDIATEKTKLYRNENTIFMQYALYWGGYGIPVLAYLFLMGFKRRDEKLRSNQVLFKNKRANKVALKRMALAEKYLKAGEQTSFFEETSKAVWLYLSDKLNIPLADLSKELTQTMLYQHQLDKATIEEVFLITDECEMALYAPDSGTLRMNQVYSDSLKLIGKLEEQLQ